MTSWLSVMITINCYNQNMPEIKHVWFDFSETLASINEEHEKFLYATYAQAVNKPVSPELINEYKEQYKKHKSNSAVFTSGLGLAPGYWQEKVHSADFGKMYSLKDPIIPQVLDAIRKKVPISIFSNMKMEKLLPHIGLDPSWFTYFISGSDFKNPKPALDGFYKMVEVTGLPAENILFVGDSVEKEMIPAKKVGLQTAIMWTKSDQADHSFQKFEDILTIFN